MFLEYKIAGIIVLFSILLFEGAGSLQCKVEDLAACEAEFSKNTPPNCKKAIEELPRCLYLAYECRDRNIDGNTSIFVILERKLKMYHSCTTIFRKEICNEEEVKKCYNAFDKSAKPLCPQARQLRDCINNIKGCHVMRNPFYTLSVGLVHMHFHCFIKNYSVILKAYEKDKEESGNNKVTASPDSASMNLTGVTPITCVFEHPITNESRSVTGYKFFGAVFVCSLIVLIAIIIFVFIRRTGLTVKQRRSVLMAAARRRERRESSRSRNERSRSSDSQRIHLTTVVEDELPPPYHIHSFPSFPLYADLPPAYTSRPSSVNGDFV